MSLIDCFETIRAYFKRSHRKCCSRKYVRNKEKKTTKLNGIPCIFSRFTKVCWNTLNSVYFNKQRIESKSRENS